jgi:pyruvate formate lyase activating enzyme
MRSGKLVGVGEMAREFGRYQRFVTLAGGGVTISGGEPLMQPRFTTALLRAAKELGLHTAVDTSGFPGLRDKEFAEPLLAHTDLVLLDIKARHAASFRRLTGVSVRPTLRFATQLAKRGIPVWLRYVLVPGVTDEADEVAAVARFAAALGNVERVDVLPFHRLGAAKYTELGLTYPLAEVAPPTPDQLTRVRQQFQDRGLLVT